MRSLKEVLLLTITLLAANPLVAAVEAGLEAPPFTLPLLGSDSQTSLADFRGKIVYLDFWASWCPPCRLSMPLMNALRNRYQQQGLPFEVVAVNVDSDPADGLDFLLDEPVDYVVLSDPGGTTPALYAVGGMPTAYLIDAKGIVRLVHEGFRRGDDAVIEAELQRLLEEMP